MPKNPKIALIQVRNPGDPMRLHELECFARQTGLPLDSFLAVNITEESIPSELLRRCDVLMLGGSGDFSFVTKPPPRRDELFELLQKAIDTRFPTFASCFGFQAVVVLLGGKLYRMDGSGEVGSFDIFLTDEGKGDPLFGKLPAKFTAQLGHVDAVEEFPSTCQNLASSELTAFQALRVGDSPVVATQFHPELSREDNLKRYIHYIKNYRQGDLPLEEEIARAEREFLESPESSALLPLFLYLELGYRSPKIEHLPSTISLK